MMKCWYCGKRLKPGQWVRVVTAKGNTVPVCRDDRNCKPRSIQGHGPKEKIKRSPRIKQLLKEKERQGET